jgi:hypothetical protein
MSKMSRLLLASAMMAAVTGTDFGHFAMREAEDPWSGEHDWERKRRLHKMNPTDTSEREFLVKGERIMAHDKKTALKIYANRHPETKSKKRKKK